MPKTQVMPEFQITQEYLGFSNHFVFLASMWREFLDSDTFAAGRGSTVAQVVDGTSFRQRLTGIAGVANTGSDRNWTGHDMLQANWYAFGRLAWSPDTVRLNRSRPEWIKMTLTHDPSAVSTIVRNDARLARCGRELYDATRSASSILGRTPLWTSAMVGH